MPGMELTVERHIPASQSRVWEVVSNLHDAANAIEAITKIEVLTGEEIGPGTRFTETRVMFRREVTETMEITAWNPPESYVVGGESCGARFETVIRCTPDGDDATMLSMTMKTTPVSFVAKLMRPIAGIMMGSMRKMIARDLDDISRACVGTTQIEDEA